MCVLRLPYMNDAEIAKFYNRWMFWPVIQPIRDLLEKGFLSDFEKIVY